MSKKPDFVSALSAYRNKFILLSFTIVFIFMAVGLFMQNLGAQRVFLVKAAPRTVPAGDLSVVGQPSLPAASVDAIFKRLGSPMTGTGQAVVQASHHANIDDAFALAVWWTETNDGASGVGLADRNPGSVRGSAGYPSAYDGYTIYPSYSAAIAYWFNMLRNGYVNRGLNTVYAISHPYVGTSSSPLWAAKVVALTLRYRGEAPPSLTVKPSPTPAAHGKKVTDPEARATTTTSLTKQAQAGKTSKQSPNIAQQVHNSIALPPSIESAIVVFALLLALAIVAWALWLDKRQTVRKTHDEGIEGVEPPFQNLDTATQNPVTSPFGGAFPPNTGTNFRIRRTILLPSLPIPETSKPGESPATSNPGERSTGLLSRYGETHQE